MKDKESIEKVKWNIEQWKTVSKRGELEKYKLIEEDIEIMELAVNIIVNQKAEIEGLNFDKGILTDTINKQIEELETLKRDFKNVDHKCKRLEKEDMRKDKMINLMVEQIVGLTIFDMKKEEPLILKNEIEVIEYFENKVKENKGK